jgi:hypothetical protein
VLWLDADSPVAYGWYSQYTNARLAALNGLKYSVWTSRGAGLVLAFDGGLILVPSECLAYLTFHSTDCALGVVAKTLRALFGLLLRARRKSDAAMWVAEVVNGNDPLSRFHSLLPGPILRIHQLDLPLAQTPRMKQS